MMVAAFSCISLVRVLQPSVAAKMCRHGAVPSVDWEREPKEKFVFWLSLSLAFTAILCLFVGVSFYLAVRYVIVFP